MELKDEEIKKALEDFQNRILNTNLSYHIFESEMMAVVNALDLINRQQAEIERLQAKCENTQVGYNFAKADVDELQKEVFEKKITYQAVIDDLKHETRNLECEKGQLEGTIDFLVAEAKSEAIKEFAERLKATYPIKERHLDSTKLVIRTFRNSIDNLLTEMVGGENA